MNTDFTIDELDMMHRSLITRERILRDQYIPHAKDSADAERLTADANAMRNLAYKVCAAKLSKELGFCIDPIVETVG
jgi:hypothetical protein